MKRRLSQRNTVILAIAAICLAMALFIVSLTLTITGARYVTEIGGGNGDLPYETQTPFDVSSQTELFNAINSGYGYVKLSDKLTGPIIMTGDELDLKRDLTIDLNGKEIQRSSRKSLLSIPTDTTLTIIDTAGGGGLYNPVGSVLTVGGGSLNVFGGMFESGPRPEEYYTTLNTASENYQFHNAEVMIEQYKQDTTQIGKAMAMPILPVRDENSIAAHSGNLYFDVEIGGIKRDTYCYVVVSGETSDDFATFNKDEADYAYSYFINEYGNYIGYDENNLDFTVGDGGSSEEGEEEAEGEIVEGGEAVEGEEEAEPAAARARAAGANSYRHVMVFGYYDDIAMSNRKADDDTENYAAVVMKSGSLNINVIGSEKSVRGARTVRKAGSFYSYFGTWHTSCIYITGGEMNVSTSGEIATVDPADLPEVMPADTRDNSAKFSENACIFSRGGTLNITKLHSATAYNGSVISVSDGIVTLNDANITKHATISHADSPFDIAEVLPSGASNGVATEFPADRQYRDAAIFLNGGQLHLNGSTNADGSKTVNVTVNKDIAAGLDKYGADKINMTNASGTGNTALYREVPMTTFAVLSRGRNGGTTASGLVCTDVAIRMQGSHSYGVFGTRGEIELTDGSITLDDDGYCYGVYAVNKTSDISRAVNIELHNTDIKIGELQTYIGNKPVSSAWVDNSSEWKNAYGQNVAATADGAMRAASIGVYLDSSQFRGGAVLMDNSKIYSQEMGVAVNGGNLTFRNGGAISAYNASAVYLNGGNILFENGDGRLGVDNADNYAIDCKLNRMGDVNASDARTHSYGMYVPWQATDSSIERYENENGIRVVGGVLKADGKLTVAFHGLYNDEDYTSSTTTDAYANYSKLVVRSFAIACIQTGASIEQENLDYNIDIKYADITSAVGGGVKVQGGNIRLGNENSVKKDISVKTTGSVCGTNLYNVSNLMGGSNYDAWKFYANLSGGYAVVARGGSIDIYNGTYTAAYCDGVAATSDDGNTVDTVVNIYDGDFRGNMKFSGNALGHPNGGPESHYGVKVMGKANVNIYGGTYDGRNGGAMVRGKSVTEKAVVKIYQGTFGELLETNKSDGQDGFNVYEFSTVYFGARSESELAGLSYTQRKDLIKVYANYFPISVNELFFADSTNISDIRVYVYYGKYFARDTANTRGIGSVGGKVYDTLFYIYGLGTNVYSQNRTYTNTRVRYLGILADEEGSWKTFRRVTTDQQYYSHVDRPIEHLVQNEYVADVP